MSKRNLVLIVAICLIIVGFFMLVVARPSENVTYDGREPERGGPSSLVFYNDGKLAALLDKSRLNFVKQDISNFIISKYGRTVGSVEIEHVILQNDGGIDILLSTGKNKPFNVLVYSGPTDLVVKIPSASYASSTPQTTIVKTKIYNNVSSENE